MAPDSENQSLSFDDYYAAELKPALAARDAARRRAMQKCVDFGLPAGLTLGLLAGFTFLLWPLPVAFFLLIVVLIGVPTLPCFLICRWNSTLGQWADFDYKRFVIPRLLNALTNAKLHYNPDRGISADAIRALGIVPHFNDYASEDRISGTLGKTAFVWAECRAREITEVYDEEKECTRTYVEERLDAQVFIADANKHFTGATYAVPDLGFLGGLFRNFTLPGCLRKTRLDSPDFEQRFDVRTTDPIEARYLLTPDFMERATQLSDRYGGRIFLLFLDEKLILILPRDHDRFEPPSSSCWDDPVAVLTHARDILAVLSLVPALDLNTRIWSKA